MGIKEIGESLKSRITFLVDYKNETLDEGDLKTISEYFEFLAHNLSLHNYNKIIPYELLSYFEAVYLILQDNTLADKAEKSISDIFEKNNICGFISILTLIHQNPKILYPNFLSRITNNTKFKSSLLGIEISSEKNQFKVDNEELLTIKALLLRVSNLIKYTAKKSHSFKDAYFEDFKQHYDPEIINREKIIALINLFKLDIKELPDNQYNKLLLEKIDFIEKEIRKKNGTKWVLVISVLFNIYSFLADFKTLHPTIYDSAYQKAEAIISLIHTEGQVTKSTKDIPKLPKSFDDINNNVALPPKDPKEEEG